jgi:hypothetical protein
MSIYGGKEGYFSMDKIKIIVGGIFLVLFLAFALWLCFLPGQHIPLKVSQENNAALKNAEEDVNGVIPSGFIKIEPQSFGNLPWTSMKGNLEPREIEGITGIKFPINTRSERIDTLNMSATTQFRIVVFVIDQSYDRLDRKVYWAENVDVQRWNTFGVNSRDQYILEKIGNFYVHRDLRGNISFFAYGFSEVKGNRVQSLVNVPWQNLSGNIPLDEVARRFVFPHLGTGSYSYNPENDADQQIISFNLSEGEKRGWQTTDRGKFEQMIFLYQGKIYEASDVEISPGDYPGGINPPGRTPTFLLLTIKAGQPEERVFVLFFYDKDKNLVAVGWTKELPSMSSGNGSSGGGTSTFSSSSSGSSSSGGNSPSSGGNSPSSPPPSGGGGPGGRPSI